MKLDKILLELEMIEAELDSIYSLKHEIQETINVKKEK